MGYKFLWPIMRWPDDRHIELDAVGYDNEAIFVDRFADVTDEQWAECDVVVSAPEIPAEYRAKLKKCRIFITPKVGFCLLYTSPSPRDATLSRMPSSA